MAAVVMVPRSTRFTRSFCASPMPRARAFWAMSFMRMGVPLEADW